ncbi:MAG: hypothetical protein AAGE84_24075 [Cyanobacteria bacterium P01_G01_bin.39]
MPLTVVEVMETSTMDVMKRHDYIADAIAECGLRLITFLLLLNGRAIAFDKELKKFGY